MTFAGVRNVRRRATLPEDILRYGAVPPRLPALL